MFAISAHAAASPNSTDVFGSRARNPGPADHKRSDDPALPENNPDPRTRPARRGRIHSPRRNLPISSVWSANSGYVLAATTSPLLRRAHRRTKREHQHSLDGGRRRYHAILGWASCRPLLPIVVFLPTATLD